MASQNPLSVDDLPDRLARCEEKLGYRFKDRSLLELSLTHASIARTRLASNERLEFLGDAILGLVVCEMLFHKFPNCAEGELTRLKSVLVSRNTCADLTRRLGIDRLMFVGKGLGGHDDIPSSILGGVLESIIAAIYLDGGLETARDFIENILRQDLGRSTGKNPVHNYKSLLQHFSQRRFSETPIYRLIDEQGPDHSKAFQVAAVIGTVAYPSAWGANKKEAEQSAAKNALVFLGELEEVDP